MKRMVEDNANLQKSPLLESILFPFIEEIRFGATQINNFRATVSLKMETDRKKNYYLLLLLHIELISISL